MTPPISRRDFHLAANREALRKFAESLPPLKASPIKESSIPEPYRIEPVSGSEKPIILWRHPNNC